MGNTGNNVRQRIFVQEYDKRYLFPGESTCNKVSLPEYWLQSFYVWIDRLCICFWIEFLFSTLNKSFLRKRYRNHLITEMKSFFNKRFEEEVLLNEKLRATILVCVFFSAMLVTVVNLCIFKNTGTEELKRDSLRLILFFQV